MQLVDYYRLLAQLFAQAIPNLLAVTGMVVFFLYVFAVASAQMFPSIYHYRCIDGSGNPEIGIDPDEFGCGNRRCSAGYRCTVSASICCIAVAYAMQVAGFNACL